MQTHLVPPYSTSAEGMEAEAILRKCVHCGFCTATCPTYQSLGDELDGPRGRIYLIKQVLEGQTPTRATQQHLDRCLTCRNCESTCPSGVQYGHLVDIGRKIVDEQVDRPVGEKIQRWLLKEGMSSSLFAPALKLGRRVRGVLPSALAEKIPVVQSTGTWPVREHVRKVLLLAGCVQPAMMPRINFATARVLDEMGIQTVVANSAGCCGAVKHHLNDQEGAKVQMRANIDAWWPWVESGAVEAIVMNASGCGSTVKDYGYLLRHDALYAEKAKRISTLTQDLSELLPRLLPELLVKLRDRIQPFSGSVAYHPPCTLQHGQKLRGGVEDSLKELGFDVRTSRTEAHLCCGSAGTYSVLQPEISHQLRDRKIMALQEAFPEQSPVAILSANMGCIVHLQNGTSLPVMHWVELLDQALVSS